MAEFYVPAMTCAGCAAAITRALKAQDADIQVDVDLPAKQLNLVSRLSDQALQGLLEAAGYGDGLELRRHG